MTNTGTRVLLAICAATVFLASGCRKDEPQLHKIGTLPEFTFINEQNQPFGTAQLKGKPWAANFMFTTCPTSCPPLAKATRELQEMIDQWDDEGPGAAVVTFTVDPLTDTPERLKAFGAKYEANPAIWSFARGNYPAMEHLVVEGFHLPIVRADAASAPTVEAREKILASKPTPGDTAHSLRFVLVDAKGQIRGTYDKTPEGLKALNHALRYLSQNPES